MNPKSFLNNILTYCDQATIGVLKYISRTTLSKFERLFWIICILITCFGSVYLIKEALNQFLAKKINVKISDERFSVKEIHFPAISICPEVLMSEERLEEVFGNGIDSNE